MIPFYYTIAAAENQPKPENNGALMKTLSISARNKALLSALLAALLLTAGCAGSTLPSAPEADAARM